MRLAAVERKWVVFAVVVFGVFVSVVDSSAMVVALPTLANTFATDLPTVQWVVVGHGLTIAALLVPVARLGDLIGRKWVYLSGFTILVFGSLLAFTAQGIEVLIGARLITAIGAAMAQANTVPILATAFESHERGRILGLQMGVVGLGAVVGPALGGLVIGAYGWRHIFLFVAVAGVAVLIAAQGVLRRRKVRPVEQALRFDWLGAALSALFLVVLLMTLSSAARVGWASPLLWLGFCLAFALLVLFIWRQRVAREPMLQLSLFERPIVAMGVLGTLTTFMGLAAMRYLVPFHVQSVLSLDATRTGLVLVPAAIVTAVASPVTGGLSDRLGARRVAHLGLAICVLGLVGLGLTGPESSVAFVVAAMMVTSFGAAAFHAPNTSSVISAVSREHVGVISGFTNLARNAGNVVGVALATAAVSVVMSGAGFAPTLEPQALAASDRADVLASFDGGARAAFWLLAATVAVVLGLSLRYARDPHAVSTQAAGRES